MGQAFSFQIQLSFLAMKSRNSIMILVGSSLVYFSVVLSTMAQALTTGILLNEAEETANELIETGFDRLDSAIVNTGYELRAAVRSARANFQEMLEKSVEEFDGQQRRAIDDIAMLVRSLENAENDQISNILEVQKSAINTLYSLASNTPIVTRISNIDSPVIFEEIGNDQTSIRLIADGVGMQGISVKNVRFGNAGNEGTAIHRVNNNSQITFDLTLPEKPSSAELYRGIWTVPLNFEIEVCGFFGFFCDSYQFFYDVAALPKKLGFIEVSYFGNQIVPITTQKIAGPFDSSRVKSQIKVFSGIKAGSRTDIWSTEPSSGARIVPESARFDFAHLNGGCSNSRSNASWVKRDENGLQVRATTSSDRKVGATCRTRTTIYYDEVSDDAKRITMKSGRQELIDLQNGIIVPPPSNLDVTFFRVSSIAITSKLFGEEGENTRIFEVGEQGSISSNTIKLKLTADQQSLNVIARLE